MRMRQTESVYYFWIKPFDMMRYSGGGHHNTICPAPIHSVPCQSAIAWTGASRTNAYVWLYKHTLYVKCEIWEVEESSESKLVCVDTYYEDALADTVKNKSKWCWLSLTTQALSFRLFKAQMLTTSMREN